MQPVNSGSYATAMPVISVMVLDGSRSIVNSRILRVQESSLLKDILCMVTSDDDAADVCADSIRFRNSL